MNQTNGRRSLGMFIASMLIFGTIGIFRRSIPLPSAFLAFSRGILGGLFLLAFLRLRKKDGARRLAPGLLLPLAGTGAMIGFNWMLLFEAYNHTTVGIATLCYYMQPTIVMLLSPVLFQERLGVKKLICAAAAVAGMVLISGASGENMPEGNPRGIALGLGAAVFYSVVVIMNKKSRGIDAYAKTVVELFSAGVVMIPYLLLTGSVAQGPVDAQSVALLAVICLVHTGIAYVLYFGSMDGMRAQSIALLSYIDPVSALLFSAVFLREPLSAAGIAGAVLIIGSAMLSEVHTDPD